MGIAKISSVAINKAQVPPFHRKNRLGAQRALLALRQVFIARICEEVQDSGRCALISGANGSGIDLKVSCPKGLRPDAIADPLNIATAMRNLHMSSIEFSYSSAFNADLVDEVLIGVICGKISSRKGVSFGLIEGTPEQNPPAIPYPVSVKEFEEILAHPDTQFSRDIEPMLSVDIIGVHQNNLPLEYALLLADKALSYLCQGKSERCQYILKIIDKHVFPKERDALFGHVKQLTLNLIAANLTADKKEHELANNFWWIVYGLYSSYTHRTAVLKIRMSMAAENASFSDASLRDIDKAIENWQVVLDVSANDPIARQKIIDNIMDIIHRFVFGKSPVVGQDIGAAIKTWKMLYSVENGPAREAIIVDIKRTVIQLVSQRKPVEQRDYNAAIQLCDLLFELLENKQHAIAFIVSLVRKRVDCELPINMRDIEGAIACWQKAEEFIAKLGEHSRLTAHMIWQGNKIAMAKEEDKIDVLAALKIWMSALKMNITLLRKRELIIDLSRLAQSNDKIREAMLVLLEENVDFKSPEKYYSRYYWYVRASLLYFAHREADLLRVLDTFGNEDLFLWSLKLKILMKNRRSSDALALARKIIQNFLALTEPDIFQAQACINAYIYKGNTNKARNDLIAALDLAKKFNIPFSEAAKHGLQEIDSMLSQRR